MTTMMEDWKLDFEWLRVRHYIKDALNIDKLPDLNSILLMIGVQEQGHLQDSYSKEEKQDLMHVAVCTLLEKEGYYEFVGRDQDGWPHWKQVTSIGITGIENQEKLLKENIIKYFNLDNNEK